MLARLRRDLDLMPSPVEDRPGLLMRDPYHYSDATLIVPPELVRCLEFFDGDKSELDLREFLVRSSGNLDARNSSISRAALFCSNSPGLRSATSPST